MRRCTRLASGPDWAALGAVTASSASLPAMARERDVGILLMHFSLRSRLDRHVDLGDVFHP
jgi:hypothetical protein